MFEFNKDYKERDKIIFGNEIDWDKSPGRIIRFESMSIETLQLLMDKKFIDPEETQNYSPPVKDLIEFMLEYPNVTALGYVVSPKRKDYRVSIEGVKGENPSKECQIKFANLFLRADEFVCNDKMIYCWYD